jgi:DNA polymerase-3 subunit gamma/tau
VSYQVFARKYRPQNFDEVVGQAHITQTLKNAIEQRRLAHAYLFVGPRGTGKTSTARILAKALNCEHGPTTRPCGICSQCQEIAEGRSLNVLEFDAASNTQVDKVRELIIDNVKYAPTGGRYKLYIVDEVHMLSNSSFNALLKTLEEPPSHVIFIFATTDPQKVPLTIISRCQRFDLRRIPAPLIEQHLQFIAAREKIALEPAAAQAIARGAEGGLRDAESMLDQLVAFCGERISAQDVLNIFGFPAQETVSSLCGAILAGQCGEALGQLLAQAEKGKDLSRLMADVITHLRDLLVMKADPEGLRADLSPALFAALEEQTTGLSTGRLLELIEQFAAAETRMKWAPNKKLHFEIAIIKAVQTLEQATLSEILDTLATIRSGGAVDKPAPPRPLPRKSPPVKADPGNANLRGGGGEQRGLEAGRAPIGAPVTPAAKVGQGASSSSTAATAAPEPSAASPEPVAGFTEPAPIVSETPDPPPPADLQPPSPPVDLNALWTNILLAVRRDRPLITTWLEAGTLLEVTAATVLLGFPPDQKMAMESLLRPNNRAFLEKLFAQLTGEPRVLECETREGLVVQPAPPPAPEPAPADPMEEFKNDPLIRKALEIFQAEIQPA